MKKMDKDFWNAFADFAAKQTGEVDVDDSDDCAIAQFLKFKKYEGVSVLFSDFSIDGTVYEIPKDIADMIYTMMQDCEEGIASSWADIAAELVLLGYGSETEE